MLTWESVSSLPFVRLLSWGICQHNFKSDPIQNLPMQSWNGIVGAHSVCKLGVPHIFSWHKVNFDQVTKTTATKQKEKTQSKHTNTAALVLKCGVHSPLLFHPPYTQQPFQASLTPAASHSSFPSSSLRSLSLLGSGSPVPEVPSCSSLGFWTPGLSLPTVLYSVSCRVFLKQNMIISSLNMPLAAAHCLLGKGKLLTWSSGVALGLSTLPFPHNLSVYVLMASFHTLLDRENYWHSKLAPVPKQFIACMSPCTPSFFQEACSEFLQ